MTHLIPFLLAQVGKDSLQAGHWSVTTLAITEFQYDVALDLFDRKNRTDRSAPLSHHAVQSPIAADGTDHRTGHYPVIEQQ